MAFGFAVRILTAASVVAFHGGFIKMAHANGVTCSDGATRCGGVVGLNTMAFDASSSCALDGKGEMGR